MNTKFSGVLGGLIFAAVAAAPVLAQSNSYSVNFDHSVAAVSIDNSGDQNSNFQMGIARTTGSAILDVKNPSNSSFNFTIFPSAGVSAPVYADGSWAKGQLPNAATYTILTFKSKQAQLTNDGRLQLTGDLTVTHFERPITLTYSEDYDGPKYGTPVVHSATHQASFVLDLNDPDSSNGREAKTKIVTASSIVSGEDFPDLLEAVLDTNWPVVIQDETSDTPATVSEDYSGASVSGTYIAKQDRPSVSQPTIGEDYPRVEAFTGPAPNEVTIQARLVLNAGTPEQSQASGN